MATHQEILDSIAGMTVLELSELLKEFEARFDVTAAAPAAVAAVAPAEPDADEVEEKTSFDVVLTEVGPKKVAVIKALRGLTTLTLMEAKKVVDNSPVPVLEGISKDEADTAQAALEAAGGVAEVV